MLIKPRIQLNIRAVLLLVSAVFVSLTLFSSLASASDAANTLKVTPLRTDVEIQPGQTKIVKVTVTNPSNQTIKVRPVANDFVAGDNSGTPALILDELSFAPTHSLKRFMGPLSEVEVPANGSKTINVTITVPSEAQAGGYFGAVRLAPATPDGGGQVNTSANVASLILLTVPGDTVEKLELTDFELRQNDKAGSSFSTPSGLNIQFGFQNKGNIQIGPFGKVSVKSGKEVIYEADFNNKNPRDVILPDSSRLWDIPLENIGTFGKYSVIATFTYGKKNQTIEVVREFWIIPQYMIIAAIALGALLVIAIIVTTIVIVKRRKRRSRTPSGGRRRR